MEVLILKATVASPKHCWRMVMHREAELALFSFVRHGSDDSFLLIWFTVLSLSYYISAPGMTTWIMKNCQ